MDALLNDKRVFKSKVTRLDKQTVERQNGTDKNIELLSIYLSSAHELAAECSSLLRSIGHNVNRNITRYMKKTFEDRTTDY
jgi:hypothetical protein